ncbi:hypothetical protein PDN02_16345 [Bacillus cereus]|nr:hypothetical protein [Bacillus cereus]MDA2076668.1 hypothetical protein [Bacillus cereus]MDA2081378.1 hypothetical protein [Bacillus cereus]
MMKKLNQLTKQDIEQMTYSEQRFTKAAFRVQSICFQNKNHSLEFAREIAFFVLNREGYVDWRKNPEQAYIIIEEAAELIDVEVFHYGIDIENVYGEEIYNEHKKEWEDFKRMIKPILQISSALRLMMEPEQKKEYKYESACESADYYFRQAMGE